MGGPTPARAEELRRKAGTLLTPLGVTGLPDTPQVLPQLPGAAWDWLVLRASEDPAFLDGTLAIPPAQRRVLRELDRRDVVFDELFIAHEIAKTGPQVQPLPGARDIRELPEPPTRQAPPAAPALRTLTALAGTLITSGRALGAAVSPLLLADPVLIGAVIAATRARPVAAFFEVVRWDAAPRTGRKG